MLPDHHLAFLLFHSGDSGEPVHDRPVLIASELGQVTQAQPITINHLSIIYLLAGMGGRWAWA